MGIFDFLKKKKSDEKEEKAKTLENVGLAGAASEVVQRFGSANKEFFVAYGGVDNETGQVLAKGLKSISESNVNPEYEHNNIHQQAGYSAEVAKSAKDNVGNIINKNSQRTIRTDDHPDYGRNHTVYDHVETINGSVIQGSGSQMKFVNNPKSLIDKIATGEGGGKNDLSRYLNVDLDLPSDQVNDYAKYCENEAARLRAEADKLQKAGEIKKAAGLLKRANTLEDRKNINLKQYCETKAQKLRTTAERLEREGKHELAAKKRQQAANYETVKDKMRDSGISTEEAVFYRKHPELATARDIAKVSHAAGVEQAKTGAAISGGISLVRNIVSVAKGEKEPDEAALSVVKDTGTGAVVSYGTAFAGSVIKGGMQNAPNDFMRSLSKTNLPAQIVTITLETGKTLGKYFKGEIDGVECLTELGEKGTGMVSSAMFAAVGQIIIPIPVIGAMAGSMLGYALSSACYNELVNALKEAKIAREERIRIEKECEEAIAMIRQYRAEMEKLVSTYMVSHIETFHQAFDGIKDALQIGDIDGFIANTNTITKKLGKQPQFETFDEFDSFMQSGAPLKL